MNIVHIFESAGPAMTVISLATFIAILAWVYGLKKERDFAASAALPFADDAADVDGAERARGEDYV